MSLDHNHTKVLIIGVSEFPDDTTIHAIPNVLANIELLRSSLMNTDIIGIPESNITVSINEDKGQIERKLLSVVNATRDRKTTLLIYYSGHGILSSNDYKLYLTTHHTSRAYLEIDGVNIDTFKSYIKRSRADRKIVILDCCHSGAFIEQSMGGIASKIQADINDFSGTYIMTSAAEDEPSLFPVKSPGEPTYFTGKFIEVLNEGLDIDRQFCSLRDIYDKIEDDFKYIGLPHPQQSNVNDVDQLLFAINRKYREKKPDDELEWEKCLQENTKWAYLNFKNLYPTSIFIKQAKQKIFELEDEEHWEETLSTGTLFAFADYLDKYANGKYAAEANNKIGELRQFEADQLEKRFWNRVIKKDDLASYENYLSKYPKGNYAEQCRQEIIKHRQIEEEQKNIEIENKAQLERSRLLEEQQKEMQRIKEEEMQAQVLEQERKKQRELEAERLREEQRNADLKKEQELELKRKEEQLKKLEELEEEKKQLKRKKEAEREAREAAAKLKKEQEIESQKIREQELAVQRKKEAEKPREFTIIEEPYIDRGIISNSKELIILISVIIILVLIFLYVIFKNVL